MEQKKTPFQMRSDLLGPQVVKALESRHFEAWYVETKEEALKKALELIPEGASVSWGGSATAHEIGLIDALRKGNYELYDRDKAADHEEKLEIYRKALLADYYISSCNGMSEDGIFVNVDGNGNRVAAISFGPRNVILVVGINKVVKTAEDAMARARNYAAPINKQRFPGETPCKAVGKCMDCKSPKSVCSYLVTTRLCRPGGRIKVILVGESLGF